MNGQDSWIVSDSDLISAYDLNSLLTRILFWSFFTFMGVEEVLYYSCSNICPFQYKIYQ